MAIGFSDNSKSLSAAQLTERVSRAASGLAAIGVKQGDCVALLMRNDTVFIEATLAAAWLGAHTSPINWHLQAGECGYILADCDARVLVAHADLYRGVAEVIPPAMRTVAVSTPAALRAAYNIEPTLATVPSGLAEWDEWIEGFAPRQDPPLAVLAPMVYTSGTTGRSKGVRRMAPTPAGAEAHRGHMARVFGIDKEMRSVVTGPLYHGSPNTHALSTIRSGGELLIQPRFDAENLLQIIERHHITNLHLVPTMFVRLLKLPQATRVRYDVSSLRFVSHGAAPCPREIKQAMIDWWGPILYEFYGATETGGVTLCDSAEWLMHPGTVGRPLPGADLQIVGPGGGPLAQGEPGEIFVRPDRVSDFVYHNLPGARQEIERDGRISLGDIGYLDAEGYLYLCDRKRDMVISGGVNIYPAEIESVLVGMPGVADCAVFGIPDAEMGESVAAAIQPQLGVQLGTESVVAWLKPRIALYKIPRHWEFVDALPRDDTGKIFKQKLRERHWIGHERQI